MTRPPIETVTTGAGNIAVIGKPSGTGPANQLTGDAVERLAVAFERSARRWEFVAYPAVVIFTLLAIYGFYQIYSVSRELRLLAEQLRPQMGTQLTQLTDSMNTLTMNIAQMSRNIDAMNGKIASMSDDTKQIAFRMNHLANMDQQVTSMSQAVQGMAMHTDAIRWNMVTMNRSIQRPLGVMNSFIPF